MQRVIFMIDGEFMRKRVIALKAFFYDGAGIHRYCLAHLGPGERLGRIMFYDALPFTGKEEHPLTGPIDFSQSSLAVRKYQFLQTIRNTPQMMLKLGRSVMMTGQWQLESTVLGELLAGEISVDDIEARDILPSIHQKGVDILLGMDLAALAYKKQAERVVLIANDADYEPAVKLAREEGLTICLDPLWTRVADDLHAQVDYVVNKLPRPEHNDFPQGMHIFDDPKEYQP